MIHLDTSILIAAFTGTRPLERALRGRLISGEAMAVSALVLYEWWRGPRVDAELRMQQFLLPADDAFDFGVDEARIAASLYRRVSRPRARLVDIAIAACAISHEAELWTLNTTDFADIPGLSLHATAAL